MISKSLMTAAAASVLIAGASAANAGVVSVKWDPAAVGLAGTAFTADNMVIADYASAAINPVTGAFNEVGALKISQFQLGGLGVSSPGLNSTYGLYFTFTAIGNIGGPLPTVPGGTSGAITSLTYKLWADPAGQPTFAVSNGAVTVGNNAGAFVLASGSGGGSPTDFVSLQYTGSAYIPSAGALATFLPCITVNANCTANESAFFVSPPAAIDLKLEASFTNTAGVSTLNAGNPAYLNIVAGGGNLDLLVPEPASLAIMGVGLLGLVMGRRRRV